MSEPESDARGSVGRHEELQFLVPVLQERDRRAPFERGPGDVIGTAVIVPAWPR